MAKLSAEQKRFFKAAEGDDAAAKLKDLINEFVNAKNENGDMPLHKASDEKAMIYLIKIGADVNAQDGSSNFPLANAAQNGQAAVAKTLIEYGANVNAEDENKCTPIHLAAVNGQHEIVKLLIENGATIDVKDKDDETPLSWASEDGHLEIVKYLIENGAMVITRGNDGFSYGSA